jgi:hypothetical protein
MFIRKGMGVFAVCFAALLLSSCGGGSSSSTSSPAPSTQASVFTIGTDAPLPSVVSCQIMVTGITIFNGTTNVSVLSQPQVIDFAQFNGLHQLVDLSSVPTGTYTSATVTIASPVIGYINVNPLNPPTASSINGTLSQSSVTVDFAQPFVLQSSDLVGLRVEFDLHQSIQTDTNGQVTGVINPVFEMQLLNSTDARVSIDDFHAGVVGVTGGSAFTVQGPHGRQWQVSTDSNTVFDDPDLPISSFTTSTIVSLTGTLDPVTHAIDASEVEVISNDKFYLGGLLTYVNPASPQLATQADIYVREELPAIPGTSDGQIESLTLKGSEIYRIGNIDLPLTTLLFNNTLMAPGQRVDIAGPLTTSNGADTLTVHRVILRRQGQAGSWVPGSTIVQSGNMGSFQLNDEWTAGVLLPSPLTVLTTNGTNFINLSGLGVLTGAGPIQIRVVGFILINQTTGQPVMVARSVEQLSS